MSENDGAFLEVRNISKHFGAFTALKDVSLGIKKGEYVSILGPSGCGKTTLLRIIAGLEQQDAGQVLLEGRDISNLPPAGRNLGIVFQSYALFPNLTAAQNVGYGLQTQKKPKAEIASRVEEMLALVGLPDMAHKYPAQLSGGQQQRVALARALAPEPSLLLLDEPLSALDAKVRLNLRGQLRHLQQSLGVTTVMVTHDQEEALGLSDRVAVMSMGNLVQYDDPVSIYERPADTFVADFVGAMNFLTGARAQEGGRYQVGQASLSVTGGAAVSAGACCLAIRPQEIQLADGEGGPNTPPATVTHLEYRGESFRLKADTAGNGTITFDISAQEQQKRNLAPDSRVWLHLPEDQLRVFAESAAS